MLSQYGINQYLVKIGLFAYEQKFIYITRYVIKQNYFATGRQTWGRSSILRHDNVEQLP